MHIRTRNDLIEWLENNVPFRAIARAMQEGQVENLGGFCEIPPKKSCGWVVRVISKHSKIWHIIVYPDNLRHDYRCHILTKRIVPWECWVGDRTYNKLYNGDKPLLYKNLRKEMRDGAK